MITTTNNGQIEYLETLEKILEKFKLRLSKLDTNKEYYKEDKEHLEKQINYRINDIKELKAKMNRWAETGWS